MIMQFDCFIEQLAEMEAFDPDDQLSKMVCNPADELSEDDLDLVFAAGHTDFQRFLERYRDFNTD